MMKEVWKSVGEVKGIDFTGAYEISNFGRFRSLDRLIIGSDGRKRNFKGQIIKPMLTNSGYFQVRMKQNEKTRHEYVHRLVAEAFCSNPYNLSEVNHKDENRLNNIYTNLEWISHNDNLNYGSRSIKFAISRGKRVAQYDLKGNLIKTWNSTREAGRNGFYQTSVAKCARGKQKTYKGFIWKYI
jgi:hypothetical protein